MNRKEGYVPFRGHQTWYRIVGDEAALLQEPAEHHRLHEVAPAADRQILVDIGDAALRLGHEPLARDVEKGFEDREVGDLVGADLAFDHSKPRRCVVGHHSSKGVEAGSGEL